MAIVHTLLNDTINQKCVIKSIQRTHVSKVNETEINLLNTSRNLNPRETKTKFITKMIFQDKSHHKHRDLNDKIKPLISFSCVQHVERK